MRNLPKDAWVVVADGNGARVLQNVSDGDVELVQRERVTPDELVNDGPSGVQPEEVDVEEATFAKHLARRLNHAALTQQFAHLVLIADPRTMGHLRPLLHKEVSDRLVGELTRTLTNAPLEDIRRVLH